MCWTRIDLKLFEVDMLKIAKHIQKHTHAYHEGNKMTIILVDNFTTYKNKNKSNF